MVLIKLVITFARRFSVLHYEGSTTYTSRTVSTVKNYSNGEFLAEGRQKDDQKARNACDFRAFVSLSSFHF